MKVALYARVSTDKCDLCNRKPAAHPGVGHEFRGQDPEVQLRELREWAQQNKHKIVDEYVDRGVSGTKKSRPELDRLMKDAIKGLRDIEAVVVWRLDRFGRSLQHLQNAVSELRAADVLFISKQEGFDLSTSMGKAFFNMLCVFAEFYRDVLAENTRAGMKLAKSKGRRPGPKVDASKGPSRMTLWRRNQPQTA
jgi:DNA invertase Pin-like site-specific DNA recombinase